MRFSVVAVVGVTGALVVGVVAPGGWALGGGVDPMAARTAAAALGTVVDRAMAGSEVDVTGGTEVTVVVEEDRTSTVRAVLPAALTTSASRPGSRVLRTPADTTPKASRTAVAHASQRAAVGVSRVSSPTDRFPDPASMPDVLEGIGTSPIGLERKFRINRRA